MCTSSPAQTKARTRSRSDARDCLLCDAPGDKCSSCTFAIPQPLAIACPRRIRSGHWQQSTLAQFGGPYVTLNHALRSPATVGFRTSSRSTCGTWPQSLMISTRELAIRAANSFA